MTGFTYKQYIKDVSSNNIVTCKWVKLAVKRHIEDLERIGEKKFPYYFDEKLAERAITFCQNLSHTKGKWANPGKGESTLIKLEPWQQFNVAMIHGWRNADGNRRFTHAYLSVARKNAKTTLGAELGNFAFIADSPREIGPEIYFAATKQDQAAIAWREARNQLKKAPALAKRIKSYESKQVVTLLADDSARMRPIGRDSDTEDGQNPSFVLVDEYHAHPDASLLEVMESGMGSREQPLVLIITTAGFDKNCPCYMQEQSLIERVLEGSIDPRPENVYGIIYTIDENDDWANPSCWIKANPNLGVSVRKEYLEQQVGVALASAGKQNGVKTKNFNIWTQSIKRWITDEQWMACDSVFSLDELKGRDAFFAFDLSSSQDLTSLAITIPPQNPDELYKIFWRYWIPEELVADHIKSDNVPYDEWINNGLMLTTPGDCVDYDFIEGEIKELASIYNVIECGYDPWRAAEVVQHLQLEGLTMVPIKMAYNPMAIYCDALEKKVLAKQIAHAGNPISRWNMSCVEMKSDRQGNIMPMKPERDKTGKRIDGIVAAIMSLGRAVVNEGESRKSVYEGRGLEIF